MEARELELQKQMDNNEIELRKLQKEYDELAHERNLKLLGKYGIFCPLDARGLIWGGGDYWYKNQELLDKENQEMKAWDEEHGLNQLYEQIDELQDKRCALYNQLCEVKYGYNAEIKHLKDRIKWCKERIQCELYKIKKAEEYIEGYKEDILKAEQKIEIEMKKC